MADIRECAIIFGLHFLSCISNFFLCFHQNLEIRSSDDSMIILVLSPDLSAPSGFAVHVRPAPTNRKSFPHLQCVSKTQSFISEQRFQYHRTHRRQTTRPTRFHELFGAGERGIWVPLFDPLFHRHQ